MALKSGGTRGCAVQCTYTSPPHFDEAAQHVACVLAGLSVGAHVVLLHYAQAALYRGAVLLAPMVSLEKASRAGLNPYLL